MLLQTRNYSHSKCLISESRK